MPYGSTQGIWKDNLWAFMFWCQRFAPLFDTFMVQVLRLIRQIFKELFATGGMDTHTFPLLQKKHPWQNDQRVISSVIRVAPIILQCTHMFCISKDSIQSWEHFSRIHRWLIAIGAWTYQLAAYLNKETLNDQKRYFVSDFKSIQLATRTFP